VKLDRLVRDISQQFPGFHSPKAEIEITEPPLPVMGHEAYLTQAIGNLVSDRVKFVAPGRIPKMRIWTEAGMAKQILGKIENSGTFMTGPILLVEDDENDVFFMRLAMEKAGMDTTLRVTNDGWEAMSYLRGEGRFSDRQENPLPCLMLLDLKLPRMRGLEVLKWIRTQPHFNGLRVIVLTSSNQDVDVRQAYEAGADAYVVKPARPHDLSEIIQCIKHYWIDETQPPPGCREWEALSLRPSHLSPEKTFSS
jgi:CheY-like chemotaxis protein